jgi:hypothetical protein
MTPGCQHNLGQGHEEELLAPGKKRRREVNATSGPFRDVGRHRVKPTRGTDTS